MVFHIESNYFGQVIPEKKFEQLDKSRNLMQKSCFYKLIKIYIAMTKSRRGGILKSKTGAHSEKWLLVNAQFLSTAQRINPIQAGGGGGYCTCPFPSIGFCFVLPKRLVVG